MTVDPFSPIAGGSPVAGDKRKKPLWECVAPVPPHAPAAPERHHKLGKPSQRWEYLNADGELLGYVCRFEEKDGGKSFRPLCLFSQNGKMEWRWEAWSEPCPLYGLDHLAKDASAPVIITEGEKSADAASALLPGYVCITSPSGSKAAGKADWLPLKGRAVTIWPDADAPGQDYARAVCKCLAAVEVNSVAILTPSDKVARGWDAGDALKEGWSRKQASMLVKAAKHAGAGESRQSTKPMKNEGEGRKRPRQRDSLLGAAKGAELWHSPEKIAFASVEQNGHKEHWRLGSTPFKRWFAGQVHAATGAVPSGQILSDVLRVLEVKAIADGPCHKPLTRIGWQDGASWLDLCDDAWRAVKVTESGWEVVDMPPVKFVRSEVMAALPEPEGGHMIEELRGFVNAEDDDFKLIIGWLIAALWGKATAFPVLALGGEQGSGKSTMARLLRALVDPSAVAALAIPKDERDFFTMAMSGHALSFDNVSKVAPWFSDSVCRLSTGAGFLTRKLHSDAEPLWFQGSRPVLLNGIPSLTDRADLAERSLTVRLLRIDAKTRRSEDEWWQEWQNTCPGVLGALLDALGEAIRRYDGVKLDSMPRMAAFAKLMTAAEPGLGWESGEFMQAYEANRRATSEASFEADPVAVAICELVKQEHLSPSQFWEGTATELLGELNKIVSEDVRRSRFWPSKVNALGNAVERAAPLLRHKQVHVSKRSTGTQRLIKLIIASD